MPKNMGKGGKSFKAGNAKTATASKRDLTLADPALGEEYAMIKKALGNLRLECQLTNGDKAIGVIRGAMVRKQWITAGDVVLVSKREFNEAGHVDIIHKYSHTEVKDLVKENEIPRDFRGAEEMSNNQQYADLEFVQATEAGIDEDLLKASGVDRNVVQDYDPLAQLEQGEDEDEDLDDL